MSNEEAKKESGPEVGQMKKGDYMIHIYMQEGKQFKAEKSDLSSPMIQITVAGKTKYTTCKKDVTKQSTVYWGEHLFFEKNNVSKNEIESAQIQIRVLNKGYLKDELIGNYEFDVTYVYFQDKHTLFNSWLALSNPESKDFNEITCYLKLGISVTGPGDDQVALNDETGVGGEDQEVMMPPSIRKEYKQLKIRFIKGEKFPNMDFGGTIDAFLQTSYMKKKLATEAVTQSKTTQETLIEQEFWLPVQWPLASDRLILKVYDKDPLKNEMVGSMFFSLKQMINDSGADGKLKWYNLYGSPLGCSGENTDKMNDYPEFASTWKGRILMHISSSDTKNPEMKVDKLNQDFKSLVMKSGATSYNEFDLIAEVGMGISLPGKKKYSIRIQINDFMIDTKAAIEQKGNYNRWSQRLDITTFKGPYKSIEELGRVYIYLLDGDNPICFWKGEAKEFLNPNPKFRWFPLTCDLAKGKVTNSWEAGLIQIKLSLNDRTKNGAVDFSKIEAWRKPPPKRLSSWKIRCFIFQCKDIPSADSDGASDPYIKIWNPDDKKIQTQVIDDNINPIFFEALELYYDFDVLANAPPVVLNIWDHDDSPLDGDDYLGRAVVYLTDASISNDDSIPVPKWHDIKVGFSDSDPACGQMLVSFSVVEDDYTYKTPINYLKLTEEIEYKEYNVEINVLGLRNLESFGLMPIKKAFIKFNLRSLLPPEKAQAVTNIKTQPSSAGSNPNINTVITFGIDLPVNPLFCPKLQCDVYDYVYKGLVQPLIGTFTLSIGDILHQIINDREEQLKDSDEIITMLKKHLQALEAGDISFTDVSFGTQAITEAPQPKLNTTLITEVDESGRLIQTTSEIMEELKTPEKVIPGSVLSAATGGLGKLSGSFGGLGTTAVGSITNIGSSAAGSITNIGSSAAGQITNIGSTAVEAVGQIGNTAVGTVGTIGGQISGLGQQIIGSSGNESPSKWSPFGSKTPQKLMRKKQTLGANIFKADSKLTKEMEEGLSTKLILEKEKQKVVEKENLKRQREEDKKRLKAEQDNFHKNLLFALYKYDDRLKMKREVVPKPPQTIFYEVGFDKQPPESEETSNKHYRRFYDDELENVKEIFPRQTFHGAQIVRGQSRGLSKGWFSWGFLAKKTDESGQVTNQKVVGQFKGRISIENQKDKELFKQQKEERVKHILQYLNDIHLKKFHKKMDFSFSDLESFEKAQKFESTLESLHLDPIKIMAFLKEQSYEEMITRMLVVKTRCIIRLYMLEGYEFAQKDIGSFSDPYLKIKCGTKKYNERDNYILDEPNPKFHKLYEFDAEFPGAPPIVIKAYDYDDLFGDDMIGKTTIDLDDRFFSPEWQQIEDKPIEYRSLFHPSSDIPQGTIICWLEIHPTNISTKGTAKIYDLHPQPVLDYELRLVVYDTEDIDCEAADAEGVADVFIKSWIDDKDKRETDTHYRCANGKASFNYRLVYNVQAPRKNYNLTIQTWDRDLFKSNDFIGEIQIPLGAIFEDVILTQNTINFNKKYYNQYLQSQLDKAGVSDRIKLKWYDEDSFYLETYDKDNKPAGKVRVGLSVVPSEMAKANAVGQGRSDPNHSPFLPPPVGRISFTLNPLSMLSQLLGPKLMRKIYLYCCLAICAALCIAMLPMIISNILSQSIVSLFTPKAT